jgi:hypothetical protein
MNMISGRARVWVLLAILLMLLPTGTPFGFVKKKKLPDLTVTGLSSDTAGTVGAQLQNVAATVVNQGKKPAGAFRVRYYLSPDDTITPDDLDTGAGCEVAGLPSGEVARCITNIDLPASLAPGSYYLGIVVDGQDTVAERDESNNAAVFGPITISPKPDGPPTDPPAGMRVDGDPSDWAGISPILTDDERDGPFDAAGGYIAGSDFLRVSVTNDNTDVYFLLEFAGAPYAGGIKLFLDTDVNPVTGCNGSEAVIFSSPSEPGAHLAFGDDRGCAAADDYPGVVESAVQEHGGHSFVEARIRIDDLFKLTPGRKDFRVYAIANLGAASDLVWSPTVYSLTEHHPGGANLKIEFDAPVAHPDFTGACGGKTPGWHYGMSLTETGGVGLRITSYKTVLYDLNGGYLMTLSAGSADDFARLFNACGAPGDYIGPNGKACSQSLCVDLGDRPGGQIDMTFDGFDDQGNQVRFTSGRLILSGR